MEYTKAILPVNIGAKIIEGRKQPIISQILTHNEKFNHAILA